MAANFAQLLCDGDPEGGGVIALKNFFYIYFIEV